MAISLSYLSSVLLMYFLLIYADLLTVSLYILDGDLKTDGFSIESCRSMVAVMDVSFLKLVGFMCCVMQMTVLS